MYGFVWIALVDTVNVLVHVFVLQREFVKKFGNEFPTHLRPLETAVLPSKEYYFSNEKPQYWRTKTFVCVKTSRLITTLLRVQFLLHRDGICVGSTLRCN